MFRFAVVSLLVLLFSASSWANAPFSSADGARIDYRETAHQASRSCASMVQLSDYRHTVISAEAVPASGGVPAHCRLSGLIPTEVRFEVNLPEAWNGRLYMYGNGGLAGTPAEDPRRRETAAAALAQGFATAYTDTGHDARVHRGGTFANNNFHKLVDYGFRAVHLTVASAKSLAAGYYGDAPRYSYFHGCSTGGRQAMLSAQRFPEDFDGILAGAPAADYSGLKFSQAWRVAAIQRGDFSPDEVIDLAGHIYSRCDGDDGLIDGLLDDPLKCDFDPRRDLPACAGTDEVGCYDEAELAALETYYAPVRIGEDTVYPAMPVGSEVSGPAYGGQVQPGWVPWLINPNGPVLLDLLGSDFFRYMVFVKDIPDFDWTQYDFQTPPDNLDEFRRVVDAVNPDLRPFRKAGGKLISYFGWADPDINPRTLIDYHAEVSEVDAGVDDYFRVYMIPGVFHCAGGPGPDRFDAMSPLIDWVEGGQAPESIPAWHERAGEKQYERLLCPWPQRAEAGAEAPERASDFSCR